MVLPQGEELKMCCWQFIEGSERTAAPRGRLGLRVLGIQQRKARLEAGLE